ncbi:MAG: hypothetical protein ACLRIS_08940 [Flavonifractor plautii]
MRRRIAALGCLLALAAGAVPRPESRRAATACTTPPCPTALPPAAGL